MTQYSSSYGGTLPFSDQTVQIALAANTALPYTIPGTNATQYRAEFSWNNNDNVWVGYGVTATTPTPGTITSTSKIERNPSVKYVRGGDVLSFKSNALVTDAGMSLLVLAS